MKAVCTVWKHRRKIQMILFIAYTVFIIYYAVLSKEASDSRRLELRFMWAYREMLTGHPEWKEDVGYNIKNVLFFIPFGFLFPNIYTLRLPKLLESRRWLTVLLSGALLSLFIELSQYIFCLGLCELDDVICNGLGALIGYWLFILFNHKLTSLFIGWINSFHI